MSSENLIVLDVPLNFGMEILDKSKFEYDLEFTGIAVPCAMVGEFLKSLKSHLHKYARMKRAVPCEEDETMKLLLLDPYVDFYVLPERVKDFIAEGTFKIVENVKIRIDFDYWSAEEILGAILPKDLEFGASFEQVGHLAHFNLRDELLPYKNIIGQVVLEKNRATLRTVVNKIGKIESVFRTFPMEVIAGEEDFDVEVKESNCRFRFDFSKTYWNSRLHHEHESLVKTFNKGEWICDVFAGVGPFVLPALKRGCNVLANDLNPNSITYMKNNIKLNKVAFTVSLLNFSCQMQMFRSLIWMAEILSSKYFPPSLKELIMSL